jgi:hypothetical protein
VVQVFGQLRTLAPLPADFHYHAVPDACVNLLFNQIDTEVAGIAALHTEATTLNLGTAFHYVGVQFFPGAWQGVRAVSGQVGSPPEERTHPKVPCQPLQAHGPARGHAG